MSPLAQAILFLLLLVPFQWLGHRYRLYRHRTFPTEGEHSLGAAENSLIGLTALLIAFSFSMTTSRFEKRRDMIIEEAAAIRSAILALDFFPDSTKRIISNDLQKYVDARIDYYNAGENVEKVMAAMIDAKSLATKIWKETTKYYNNGGNTTSFYVVIAGLSAMNESLFKREASRRYVTPRVILWILVFMMFLSGFLGGYGAEEKGRNLLLALLFALMSSFALYLILELDRPREGNINLHDAEQQIVDLRLMFDQSR